MGSGEILRIELLGSEWLVGYEKLRDRLKVLSHLGGTHVNRLVKQSY